MRKYILPLLLTSSFIFGMEEYNPADKAALRAFPNYFSFMNKKGRVKEYMEYSFSLILDRLSIPHEENGKIVYNGFFNKIQEKANAVGATAYISGGVVRSILGYGYEFIHKSKSKFTSPEEMAEVLGNELRRNKSFDPFDVLGIGSDLDILIEYPENVPGEKRKEIEKNITNFINSAETFLKLRDNKSPLKKVLLPIGDVKEYHKQINRTTAQGGSTMDWLAFSLKEFGTIKEPKSIIKNFINGFYLYENGVTENGKKQALRGLRPMWEIPFLSCAGLEFLIKDLASGDAAEQDKKMIRNAREHGGGNSYQIKNAAGLYDALQKNGVNVPEFSQPRIFTNEDKDDLAKNGILISNEEFIEKYTDNGFLFHGTPDMQNAISMIRGNMLYSNSKQGTVAVYGGGFYTSKDFGTAKGYAKDSGIVMRLEPASNLRILDCNSEKGKTFYSEAKEKYKGRDFHAYLKETFDIDVIIPEGKDPYPLIQSANALKTDVMKKWFLDVKELLLDGALKDAQYLQLIACFG